MLFFRRLAVLSFACLLGSGLGFLAKKYIWHEKPVFVEVAAPTPKSPPPGYAQAAAKERETASAVFPAAASLSAASDQQLAIAGYAKLGQRIRVQLTDGRILAGFDDSLQGLYATYALVDGKKVYFKTWKPAPKVGALSPTPSASAHPESSTVVASAVEPAKRRIGSWEQDADGVWRISESQRIGDGYTGIR